MLEVVREPLSPGAVVGGRFRLERPIGQGGMGSVWAARDETGALRALKFARTDRPSDPKTYERLLREARAASLVRHPNVVPVLAVLETDHGLPCLVMPLLEGESLRAHLSRRGSLPVPECARLFAGVVAGVGAVHGVGIVHRDLKPENVFLHAGAPLVLDFGIAKEAFRGGEAETLPPSLTSTGAVLGTPHYMAPEQIYGEKDVDTRADIWALGLMLYEALTGTLPTHGEGFGQIMKRITASEFPPIVSLAPHVPSPLADLVAAMLSKDRTRRPALAVVSHVLATYAAGAIPSAGPSAPPPAVSPYASTALYVADAPRGGTTAPAPRRSTGVVIGILGALVGVCGLAAAGAIYMYTAHGGALPGVGNGEPTARPTDPPPIATGLPPVTAVVPAPSAPPAASSAPLAVAPSASTKRPGGPAPKPPPPERRYPVFESGTGRYSGMGPESASLIRAVNTGLPTLRPCFPAPTDDLVWSAWIRVYWPKGGKRIAHVTAVKNGTGQAPAPESAAMVACVQTTFDGLSIPDATGQDYNDGGASYLFANAGYYLRSGPAPSP